MSCQYFSVPAFTKCPTLCLSITISSYSQNFQFGLATLMPIAKGRVSFHVMCAIRSISRCEVLSLSSLAWNHYDLVRSTPNSVESHLQSHSLCQSPHNRAPVRVTSGTRRSRGFRLQPFTPPFKSFAVTLCQTTSASYTSGCGHGRPVYFKIW